MAASPFARSGGLCPSRVNCSVPAASAACWPGLLRSSSLSGTRRAEAPFHGVPCVLWGTSKPHRTCLPPSCLGPSPSSAPHCPRGAGRAVGEPQAERVTYPRRTPGLLRSARSPVRGQGARTPAQQGPRSTRGAAGGQRDPAGQGLTSVLALHGRGDHSPCRLRASRAWSPRPNPRLHLRPQHRSSQFAGSPCSLVVAWAVHVLLLQHPVKGASWTGLGLTRGVTSICCDRCPQAVSRASPSSPTPAPALGGLRGSPTGLP